MDCANNVFIFPLQELVKSFQAPRTMSFRDPTPLHVVPSSASLYGSDISVEDQRKLVDSIARHIIYGNCIFLPMRSFLWSKIGFRIRAVYLAKPDYSLVLATQREKTSFGVCIL